MFWTKHGRVDLGCSSFIILSVRTIFASEFGSGAKCLPFPKLRDQAFAGKIGTVVRDETINTSVFVLFSFSSIVSVIVAIVPMKHDHHPEQF